MRRVVIGTAGHIDHGKTSLVQALTGIDCDRWQEEKDRGITIDLGFAHLRTELEGEPLQLGFVDVPGHQKFLHNALAGLGGIRVVLLVVAADEGVKPQTREHLEVCSLLEIPSAVVAMTKADLAPPDLLELAELEVAELLAEGPFADSRILPVSSVTGEGVEALHRELLQLAWSQAVAPEPDRPARLPLDRAFLVKGVGVVVTGTLVTGVVRPGDTLQLLPGGQRARVRAVQVHGETREGAQAGERTSLQLTGVELAELHRGLQLVSPDSLYTTRELCAELTLLPEAPPVRGWVPARIHHFASEVVGKLRPLETAVLEPGTRGAVELRLSAPVAVVRGDRFILRRPSPASTLGGGQVLDPAWRRRRGRGLGTALKALAEDDAAVLSYWVDAAGEAGASSAALAPRLGRSTASVRRRLASLASEGKLLKALPAPADRWVSPAVLERVIRRARTALDDYFKKDRLAAAMPKAEAVHRILPGAGAELAPVYLRWLVAQKVLEVDGDVVRPPGREAQLSGDESRLAQAVLAKFEAEGLTPPSPAELARQLAAKPQIVDGVVRYLIDGQRLRRLPNGLILATAAIEALVATLRSSGWDSFTVARFKDRFGLSRKWAIPLLEHLDSLGITRRVGDERQIVRSS